MIIKTARTVSLRLAFRIAAALVLLCAVPARALEQQRIALVIGNGAYTEAPLANPVNDASDLAARLRALGFSVELRLDANQRTMEESVAAFTRRLTGDGKVGLFYFAGHGIEYQGRNYLIPIGARIGGEGDLRYEAVDAGRVLDGMEAAGNGLNLVVLDACRNNPFRSGFRSLSRGLARMSPPRGTLVLYATQPGAVAQDGQGRNGVFTRNLLAVLDEPGLPVEQVFKRTAQGVDRETGSAQTPWVEGVVLGDFAFTAATASANAPVPPPADTATSVANATSAAAADSAGAEFQTRSAAPTSVVPPAPPPPPQPLGHLQVNTDTEAQVQVDGRPVGTAAPGRPLNLPELPIGEHRIEASAPGRVDRRQTVRLEPGAWTQAVLTLEAAPMAERSLPPPPAAAPVASPGSTFVVKPTSDGFVSVRTGPGTENAELRRLTAGTRVNCTAAVRGPSGSPRDRWRFCPKLGGYVFAGLLAEAGTATTLRTYRVRQTSDGFVAVRSQPSTAEGRRVGKLHPGQIVACGQVSADGDWLLCPDVGGWVYAGLLASD